MNWETVVSGIVMWVSQWLKTFPNLPNIAVQVGTLLVVVGLYALQTPPAEPYNEWLMEGITWGFAIVGGASMLGNTIPALKTNSK